MSFKHKRTVESANLSDSEEEPNNDFSIKRKRSYGEFASISGAISENLPEKNIIYKSDQTDYANEKKFKPTDGSKPSLGAKLMKKMGHQEGKGLGRYGQGMVAPINESIQKGRMGLGNESKGHFDKKIDTWNFSNDPVNSRETPEWLTNTEFDVPDIEILISWKQIGKKKKILDDECHFCSKEILKEVLDCKSIFDNLDGREMRQARSKSNPFESIAACFFMNRAAMKMANIDAVFNFQFTDPKYSDGISKVNSDEPFYFCDVCAGPGGFSEYVIWRNKWKSKGFGMTLKEENDFKLEDFIAGSPAYFETFYGADGDGDVTKKSNLKSFENFVLAQTNNIGVHCFMADGGFSVEGNENIQEILSKQLYLCQFLSALSVLRIGGNFVCKIFDIFTPFSVGLVYLLYLCFDRISIHKPVTSRPANSERYIVCEGAQETKEIVKDYLYNINDDLNEHFRDENSLLDVTHIVPLGLMKDNIEFFKYITESNEKLGKIQCVNLKKIQAFASNKSLYDTRQAELYEDCLKYWNVPTSITRAWLVGDQKPEKPRNRFQKIKVTFNPSLVNYRDLLNKFSYDTYNYQYKNDINSIVLAKFNEIDASMWNEYFKKSSIYDYKCAIGCGNLVLLLGCGDRVIYELELNSSLNCFGGFNNQHYDPNSWKCLDSKFNFELPKETLLIAEKCVEYSGEGYSQESSFTIQILDAFFIEGENMSVQRGRVVSFEERIRQLNIFVKSVTKKSKAEYSSLRVKELIPLEDLNSLVFENLSEKVPRNSHLPFKYGLKMPLKSESNKYVYPSGIYFFKIFQSPWSMVRSKSKNKHYYYKSDVQYSTYELPDDNLLFAPPKSYIENGFIWKLKNDDIESDSSTNDTSSLSKIDLIQKINMLI